MVFEALHHRRKKQFLGGQGDLVGVGVAIAFGSDFPGANQLAQFRGRGRAIIEEPAGRPVRPAHVAGKEGNVEFKVVFDGNVADPFEIIEAGSRDRVRVGLEVVPEQKDTDQAQAKTADEGKFFANLVGFKLVPPVHGFAPGPVIYP